MLKRFLLNALSSFVGAWAAFVLIAVACVLLIVGALSSVTTVPSERLKGNSVLRLRLSGTIDERENRPMFDYSTLMTGKLDVPQSLKSITEAINKAASIDDIDAIFIECQGVAAGPATLNAIRNSLMEFKKSGKKIIAYGDNLTMGDYFIASAADDIYLNPAGSLDLHGINGTTMFFKDFLDNIGVDIEVVKVGTFKSAVEPYISNEMSEPARAQLDTLYGVMWNFIKEKISTKTKVKQNDIDTLVNNYIFLDEASSVEKLGLVTNCLYYRQVLDTIGNYIGKDTKDINFVSTEFLAGPTVANPKASNQIAVLYAVGDIAEYEGAGINCYEMVPIIVRLAEDENVKGMVLRVNSPGGSVFGSEQIGEALDYFQSKGKVLTVSMGDYAASGGYWISAGADRIFADPLTITGSIGIFGMVPNIEKLTDKIGIHPQTVGTNPSTVFPQIFYPMSESQHAALQRNVERGYETFVTRVAKGRKKEVSYIKSIAEGRVWNAMTAKKIGLVDELGGVQDAISWTAQKAGLNKYNTEYYPHYEEDFFTILPMVLKNNAEFKALEEKLKAQSVEERLIRLVEWFLIQNHIQARYPYYQTCL